MRYYCTYFNINYIISGVTLLNSLREHSQGPFRLFVICMDDDTFEILQKLHIEELCPIPLKDVEAADHEFARCRDDRSLYEYFFTITPVMPLYIFEHFPETDLLTYLDADLLFYSDPEELYRTLGEKDMLITPHRFPEKIKYREKFGIYNVSMQIYRRSENCFNALRWWRERCLEWCFDRVEENRFADQKYLNYISTLPGVAIAASPGIGLAPWNWYQYDIKLTPEVLVDGDPLVFYHFQGFKVLNSLFLQHNLGHYGKVMEKRMLDFFYCGYLKKLSESCTMLQKNFPQRDFSLQTRHNRSHASRWRTVLSGIRHRALMLRPHLD